MTLQDLIEPTGRGILGGVLAALGLMLVAVLVTWRRGRAARAQPATDDGEIDV